MGSRRAGLALVLLLVLALAVTPDGSTARAPGAAPAGPRYADVAAWDLMDRWTYATHAVTRFPDGTYTDSTLVVDTVVTEVRAETVRGAAYTLYNATTTGTASTAGQLPVPGFGTVPFTLSGTTAGWVWTDRSNLALVATNQTGTATGVADLPPPFPDAPIDADGAATVLFVPAQERYDFPLEGNDAWSYNVTANTTGYAHVRVQSFLGTIDNMTDLTGDAPSRSSLWFNGTEDVIVPAGTFLATARIHQVEGAGTVTDAWYHPTAKNLVKSESHTVNAPDDYVHVWVNLTSYALANPRPWTGTIALDPSRVNPGGWLTANGTANPGEDLRVSVPATGGSFTTRTDGAGSWSLQLRAPAADDFTPANADVGSHGILVHPLAAPETASVATVQLILPDLYVLPSDLSLSNPSPAGGVPVDVNGTVRAGGAVGISSPFNASLTVDGVEMGRWSLVDLPAGASRTFGVSWLPRPGWHALAFHADPDGLITETDEGNNTAARSVFVSGPDLVLWNLTVESETSVTVVDPGAVGFVAPPVQGRLGGVVNVTMSPANVGAADAPAGWVVRIVETVGLRGPPIGPVIWESTAIATLPAGGSLPPSTARWSVPSRAGVYHWNVTIDAAAVVDEESESNNTFVVVLNVSGPDYAIVGVVAPAKVTVGTSHFLDVTVRNEGQLDGDRSVTLAAYEGASSTPFYVTSVPALVVSDSTTYMIPWWAPASGTVVALRFAVDPEGVLEEMLETNNNGSAIVDVRDRPTTQLAWDGRSVTTPSLHVTSATTFLFTAVDRSGDGLLTYFRVDGGAAQVYGAPFALAAEGPHTIDYWSEDNLGGEEPARTLLATVDDSPPVTTIIAGNRTGDRVLVTLTATDAWVGVARIEYRVGEGNWTTYGGPFEVVGYGAHNVTYRAIDRLDHAEAEGTLLLTIVRAPPPGVNLKPLLAAVFAAILFAVGALSGRKRGWSLASPRAVGAIFALAEVATGAISTVTPALQVPPYGLGLAVDLVVLLAGLFAVLFLRRPAAAVPPPDAGTDK